MKRTLGKSDISISAMGLGCWAIGGPFWDNEIPCGWGEVDDAESARAIRKGLDAGITFFDTADVYGAGHSERVLGRELKSLRDKVVIATKFGNCFNETSRQITGSSAEPAYIRQACEASLRRLQTDYVDLYQFHINEYDTEKAVEVRDTLEALVREGKIRAYAWSTDDVDRAEIFAQGGHCGAIQHEINVISDNAEMISLVERHGIASINRGPLAMGLLTGKYSAASRPADSDVRGKKAPQWMRFFSDGRPAPEWLEKAEAVQDILRSRGRTVAQGAIAWLWARSTQTIPIPGFRNVSQVEDLTGALEFGPLTESQMSDIDAVLNRQP